MGAGGEGEAINWNEPCMTVVLGWYRTLPVRNHCAFKLIHVLCDLIFQFLPVRCTLSPSLKVCTALHTFIRFVSCY